MPKTDRFRALYVLQYLWEHGPAMCIVLRFNYVLPSFIAYKYLLQP